MNTISPQFFVDKWRTAALKERSAYQQHFLDLCQLVGHKTPAEMDPVGDTFCFEMGAAKSQGGNGFADVWYKDHFAFEYKGKHADLEKAYQQLLQYREALQNPPLLIVSDIDSIQIHTNFTGTTKRIYKLTLDDLLTPGGMDLLRKVFYHPYSLQTQESPVKVTERAAEKFALLADTLRKAGYTTQESAHFLIRLLFCLFAEDTGLLPEKLFTKLAINFRNNPKAFTRQMCDLFDAMAEGGGFGTEVILHFDGRLFDDAQALDLPKEGIEILIEASRLDWANIEPSIFGTLFERSLDPSKRSQLGAHYTSKEDILLIVEPVLMAPLRRKWAEVQAQAQALAEQRDAETGRKKANLQEKLNSLLMTFADEIAQVQVLDPACGSGNFLYIALRELLHLQKAVIEHAAALGAGRFFPSVSPAQLHGIEINEMAHQLAQASIQIGYIQWMRDNGFGIPTVPILKPLDTIVNTDAILGFDEDGRPFEPEWPAADVIIGNPPFLGGNKIRAELGDHYVNVLFKRYEGRVPAFADLVCYWFEKARAMIQAGTAKRAGLLATNSIRGGANRKVLERINQSGNIFWAQSDREWVLDGAAVNVSMVGFDNGEERKLILDGLVVTDIHSDLSATVNLTRAAILHENAGICFMGPSAKAPFDIDYSLAQKMMNLTNPHGRPNSDVVRPVASAVDLVQKSRDKWTIDFALLSMEEACLYEAPFEYVKKVVFPVRSQNNRAAYAAKWWQYAEARPGMRSALQGLLRYIATPGVSKYRLFIWMNKRFLCNQGTLVIARSDDYFLGVLQSHIHELWALKQGTSLEDRPRYTPTSTFETFPFPWPPGKEPQDDPRVQAIAAAAKELVEKRDNWLNAEGLTEAERKKRTLTNLYNARPTWLDLAHKKLDSAVFAAYGWPADLTDEQILERLLALNLERAVKQG